MESRFTKIHTLLEKDYAGIMYRSYGAGTELVCWQVRAVLKGAGESYLLDDIEYGGDWTFQAGTSTLRRTLSQRD